MTKTINLYGRVFIECEIETKTGLHIGGAESSLAIGGVDNVIIRDPLSGQPYIPGSSLKGKMRSLAEKLTGAPQNRSIGRDVSIHVAGGDRRQHENDKEYKRVGREQYDKYWVNPIFGVPGEIGFEISASTRLVVRDVKLTKGSVKKLDAAKTDLPFSEVKWEAAIDRVTSAAVPRQLERVPAGAIFGPAELIYSVYELADIERFAHVIESMQLLEDDYLGGSGSRGSGKVAFQNIYVYTRACGSYDKKHPFREEPFKDLDKLAEQKDTLLVWLKKDGVPVQEG